MAKHIAMYWRPMCIKGSYDRRLPPDTVFFMPYDNGDEAVAMMEELRPHGYNGCWHAHLDGAIRINLQRFRRYLVESGG